MFLNVRACERIEKEEKDNQVSSKLVNDRKLKCNNYFIEAYIKICFKEKNKKNNHCFCKC